MISNTRKLMPSGDIILAREILLLESETTLTSFVFNDA